MTTYYVNYATGSDANSGTSASSPWQHAPGDTNATGNVTKTTLVGGDEVLFKAGVVYQGSIAVPASGAAGKPILYEGTGWGSGQAILSGLTSVQVNFTPDPGNPNISVATLPPGMTPSLANIVEIDGKLTWMTNNSTSTDPNFPDTGAIPYTPSEMTGSGTSWTFTDAALGAHLAGESPSVISNLIFRAYVAGNNQRNFTVTGFNPATNAQSVSGGFVMPPTQPNYNIYNDPALVSASNPYPEYAVEGNQIIAAVAPGLHTVSVSTAQFGLRATNKSNVTFDGFNISDMAQETDEGSNSSTTRTSRSPTTLFPTLRRTMATGTPQSMRAMSTTLPFPATPSGRTYTMARGSTFSAEPTSQSPTIPSTVPAGRASSRSTTSTRPSPAIGSPTPSACTLSASLRTMSARS
jgi:hypothetical protein